MVTKKGPVVVFHSMTFSNSIYSISKYNKHEIITILHNRILWLLLIKDQV